jgi:Porin subfamily
MRRARAYLRLCAAATSVLAGSAFAGDLSPPGQPPASPNDVHCRALGQGFFAVSGSDACIRISGYVAAGADFSAGPHPDSHNGPFGAASTSTLRTRTGVSLDARFETPMGPGRLYIQTGHDAAP